MIDATEFGKAMGSIVREAVSPLIKRIEELEARSPLKGDDGKDGTSVTVEDVTPLIDVAVAKAVAAIPVPENGKDGTSITLEDVAPIVSEAVRKAVSEIPAPEPGLRGEDGTSVTLEDISPMVIDAVAKAVAELPVPELKDESTFHKELCIAMGTVLTSEEVRTKFEISAKEAVSAYIEANPVHNGTDGVDGKDATPIEVSDVVAEMLGTEEIKTLVDLYVAESVAKHFEENPVKDGKDAEPVTDAQISKHVETYLAANPPKPGEDGTSVTADDVKGIVELEVMKGLLDLERRAGEVIQRAADAIPKPKDGIDGKDGADFTNVEIDYDGERSLIIRGTGGEIVKHLPIPIDRGYWREGMKSEKGDVVTQEGSAWIALKDTSSKPCRENAEDWRMLARKGRDGGPGPAGKDYKPPEPVKLDGSNG